jgi:serine/threonine protein kinase
MLDFEAEMLADFLGKMIKWEPKDRASAREMLKHPWLKMQPRYETKMSRNEVKEFKRLHGYHVSPSSSSDTESVKEDDNEESKNPDNNKPKLNESKNEDDWESDEEGGDDEQSNDSLHQNDNSEGDDRDDKEKLTAAKK